MSAAIKSFVKYFLALIILYLLYRSGLMQFKKVSAVLFDPIVFSLGLFLFSLQFIIFSLRWKLVASIKTSVSNSTALKQHLIGQFFNTFIPGGVGGDVIKAISLSASNSLPKTESISLTLVDRVFGIFGLILFSFIFLVLDFKDLNQSTTKYLYISAFMLSVGVLCLFVRKKIQKFFLHISQNIQHKAISKVKDLFIFFFENLNSIFDQKKVFIFLLISFCAQLISIFFIYFVVQKLSPTSPSFLLFFPLVTFGFMAMAIPITPGAIGIGQMAFYFIFKTIDESTAQSAIIAISLMQFFILILSLPGGYYFFRSNKPIKGSAE